jgi:preprotein translocase subunit YajC
METNWLIIILVIIPLLALIVFFIKRNQKDKKDFMLKLIKSDEVSIHKENDTEVNPAKQ